MSFEFFRLEFFSERSKKPVLKVLLERLGPYQGQVTRIRPYPLILVMGGITPPSDLLKGSENSVSDQSWGAGSSLFIRHDVSSRLGPKRRLHPRRHRILEGA